MEKVLVYGGSGFLGSYLVDELVKNKYDVWVADIKKPEQKVNYVHCNILDRENVNDIQTSNKFDFVYNLAGFANLDDAAEHPFETIQLNVIGNLNILDACVKNKVKRFIYASSAYAMSNKGSYYGISKLTSEKIIEEYHKNYNLPFTILRFGSVYSEKNFYNNYIYHLIDGAIKNKTIIHEGDGEEIREYIHALDAASLSVMILKNLQFENQHLVLTGTERMKRIELFKMISEILNNEIKIELKTDGYHNHYKFTPYSYQPSVSKKLTANPFIDLGQGILECIHAVTKNAK